MDVESKQLENAELNDPMKAVGKVKVELLDPVTNEVVQKSETENFIAKGLDQLYQMQMKNLFQRHKATGGTATNEIADPFRMMYLTDAKHDEDKENEWLIRGNVIGRAQTDRSSTGGTSTTVGSYNSVESFVTEDQVRIVVDFQAQAANGEIGSIYFAAGGPLIRSTLSQTDAYDMRFGAVKYRDRWYMPVRYQERRSLDVLNEQFEVIESYVPDGAGIKPQFISVAVYDDHVYGVIYRTSSDYRLVKIPINELDMFSESTIDSYTLTLPSGGPSASRRRSITYMPDRNQFAVGFSFLTNVNVIEIYDTDFNRLKTIDLGSQSISYNDGSGFNANNTCLPYEDGLLLYESFSIDIDNELVIPRGNEVRIGAVVGDKLYTYGGKHEPKIGFSSRAKLTSPVVKTSTFPMKVTYDFILPSFYD